MPNEPVVARGVDEPEYGTVSTRPSTDPFLPLAPATVSVIKLFENN